MSDSSSDDEHLKNLQQSVDSSFINDYMFNKKKPNGKEFSPVKKELPPSLRNVIDEQNRYDELHVTPEFRKHVAKHLSTLLDKQFKEVQPKASNTFNNHKRKKQGVRLLRNSTSYVLSEDEVVKVPKKSKKKVESSDSEEEREKLSMVVVSPEWVINKEGTKGWSDKIKGDVIEGVLSKKTKKKKKVKV